MLIHSDAFNPIVQRNKIKKIEGAVFRVDRLLSNDKPEKIKKEEREIE